jgi:hypothetical protein
MARPLNHRLAKIHRTYSVEEIGRIWKVHRNTVRHWIKQGLRTIDDKRPFLIHGRDLFEFLMARRTRNRRTCRPGEIYCVRCREPRIPAGNLADCQPISETQGNLIGICPVCECCIYRRVSLVTLDDVRGDLDVRVKEAEGHIGERAGPSVNSDFLPGEYP